MMILRRRTPIRTGTRMSTYCGTTRGEGGTWYELVLVREDLFVGSVVRPLPLRHFVVDSRDVEDVTECQTQR